MHLPDQPTALKAERPAQDFNMKHAGFTATTVVHFQLGVDINLQAIFTNLDSLETVINRTDGNSYTHDGKMRSWVPQHL